MLCSREISVSVETTPGIAFFYQFITIINAGFPGIQLPAVHLIAIAHEAIRPTYMNEPTIEGTAQEKRLYELIWKRTIASQMADAQLEYNNLTIGNKLLAGVVDADIDGSLLQLCILHLRSDGTFPNQVV